MLEPAIQRTDPDVSTESTGPTHSEQGIGNLKATLKRQDFLSRLQIVGRALSSRAVTQALSGVLISVGENGLVLRATDMEMGLQAELPGQVEGDGAVLVPGRQLVELARSLSAEEVTLETREAERDVEIRSGGAVFHLRTLPSADFPRFPEIEGDPLKIPTAAFT